ncbi:hypothetical protein [Streptomyces cellulosae]|uniref:hypothetical protein n=1 Tax=Streptomyces cellulosae TaxID=1968 RepID=UPI0004C89802|nr:hypothetical protein [Streptomyces cellulosae]
MLFRKPAFATLRLILAGTCDRHPDLLNSAATHLQRRVLCHLAGNLAVPAHGAYIHRMLQAALDVSGPIAMFGADSTTAHPQQVRC